MPRDPDASPLTLVGRGLRRRCPRCSAPAFASYFHILQHCRGCGLTFEREEGYWAGALIVNLAVTFIAFFIVFLGGVFAMWPDVPWGVLMGVTIGVNAVVPVVFYPISKTVWLAMEMSWHPLEDGEITEAMQNAERLASEPGSD